MNGTDPGKTVFRANGPMLSGYVPNPPVRNPLKITIPSSKPSRPRSTQSAAEQLGVRSPPPIRVNGGITSHCLTCSHVCGLATFLKFVWLLDSFFHRHVKGIVWNHEVLTF